MEKSSFADRFWYARKLAGIGAPTLMREVARAVGRPEGDELSPSLVSTIERSGQKSSIYNDAFAKVLNVDASWLANEEGPAPRGFDTEKAQAGRLAEAGKNRRGPMASLAAVAPTARVAPDWSNEQDEEQRAQRLQAKLTADLIDFSLLVGVNRVTGFLKTMEPLLASFAKEPAGQNKRSPSK